MLVVDASVAMAWCFPDEASPETDGVLDLVGEQSATVPMLWHLEVINVLLVAERRGRIAEAQSTQFLNLLGRLPIETDRSDINTEALLAAGRRHQLSAYHTTYLLLAEHLGAPLATLDARLARAARTVGLPLVIEG